MTRIAIIGGGVGGLTLAHALRDVAAITVFEKGRGLGGRTSTRREGPFNFDHGAPCFTCRTPEFDAWLAPLRAAGVVAQWAGPVVNLAGGRVTGPRLWTERHLVGVPGMNAIAQHLATGLDIRVGTEVAPLVASGRERRLYDLTSPTGAPLGHFDVVVSTAPPHQTRALFGPAVPAETLPQGAMKPRHALMAAWERPWPEPWIAAKVQDGRIRFVSVDSSKPGRNAGHTTLVAHTRSRWSALHEASTSAALEPLLLEALRRALPVDLGAPALVRAHRWRSALVASTPRSGPWYDAASGLAATSDWALTSRIEEVCLAALSLADRIKAGLS
ncbi:NAD(P)-binding protein [Ancylobacter sp. WKF20]|uniref:NAD(P)/FAD-dependent oxidoreductase n=1 Tax=Ancylobacter sp. WKF20 TaxID=3039801 RepID=UPI0024343BE9|nr:NAD(P)-binding protein [Ancylobacter sp. WKF20]WGD29559.1 NAD(P)-binding protein [Ancylobacter sp. WKF20]